MSRAADPILIDTNVILECHRTATWRALAGGFRVETVVDCVVETQTGFQRRKPEQRIDEADLRRTLACVYDVSATQRAAAYVQDQSIALLDAGERALWAHALARTDHWVLSGPDKASLCVGVRLGFRDRLVALETLLNHVGHRPGTPLRPHYTRQWLERCLSEITLSEGVPPA